ncbi:uncharacterized protein BDCG_00905 [Blastomyces dermatitidis ER-3]|uniref:Uncharacterized protein n=2 Tax=Blastomyces TaxID=229219 RepID=A0A179UIN0_BLAGS|nr:uncharacterized protein BDBG_03118 [Blastomyces gilchristii SLH14081]XP_045272150.1 uncharacterized protein BDCG_00905 [Blastomyces dermatitidis ER-3]EEQ84100.2 hypothetical protein BDCG_00905 [Blastomyces dermatitidis ER-3]OAT07007.1 hypothetical protein BDBG_03118 [Blastomyces gilchristii SLH14081]
MFPESDNELARLRVMNLLGSVVTGDASEPIPAFGSPSPLNQSNDSSSIGIQDSTTVQQQHQRCPLPYISHSHSHPSKAQNNRIQMASITPRPSSRFSKRSSSCESLRTEQVPIMRFFSRRTPNLQLPPFESLGISNSSKPSNPPPSSLQNSERPPFTAGEPSTVAIHPPSSPYTLSETPSALPYSRSISLPLTPPEETLSVKWNPESDSPISDVHSSPNRHKPSQLDSLTNGDSHSPKENNGQASDSASQAVTSNGAIQPSMEQIPFTNDDPKSWLKNGIELAVSSLKISKTPGQAVQMVSQTLPCPPIDQTPSSLPVSAFSNIVEEIQRRLQADQSPYINIIHAVPPKFSLNNLPTSPPSTPNRMSPDDDYFNLTVFSSGAPVPAYASHRDSISDDSPGSTHTHTAIVPPYSVHISIVERYLPPPSSQEYRNLFSATGPSVLVDRLRELSPQGGNLVLIYPTKQGARTFKNEYLGPILDPLLRQMVVVNELSADISKALGSMPAIAEMDDFEAMQNNILRLCENLRQRESSLAGPAPTRSSRFTLVYGGKGEICMDRKSWIEWYIQQETPRARDILNGYWRVGYQLPTSLTASSQGTRQQGNREISGPSLLQVLFQGLRNRASIDMSADLGKSMEVGVFVIRRSQ